MMANDECDAARKPLACLGAAFVESSRTRSVLENAELSNSTTGMMDSPRLLDSAHDAFIIQRDHKTSDHENKRRKKKDCKHCRSRMIEGELVKGQEELNVNKYEKMVRLNEQDLQLRLQVRLDEHSPIDLHAKTRAYPSGLPPMFWPMGQGSDTGLDTRHPCVSASASSVVWNGPNLLLERKTQGLNGEDLSKEKKPVIRDGIAPVGMRVNSIYSQDSCFEKRSLAAYSNLKDYPAFQRAYSFAEKTQIPATRTSGNLRQSVRGELSRSAKLHKHWHGWRLDLTRSLKRRSPGRTTCCTFLLFTVVFTLLGFGSLALYILCEPAKFRIIQEYLNSPMINSSRETGMHQATIDSTSVTNIPTEVEEPVSLVAQEAEKDVVISNYTRYCDDCASNEVCVALVSEEVPTCRFGLDQDDPTGCAGLCLINRQRCHRLDVDAFKCIEVEQYCLDDEWKCLNALCIPMEKRCDGHMNCYDHSDEYNCDCDLRTHFHCGNETSCLPLAKKCDGKIDCWDASDEINCILGRNLGWSCPSEQQFTCSTGECILKVRFCDGLSDCEDGSDEPHGCQGRCNKHEFMCTNKRCIAKITKCNGVDDCGDGSDEKYCKNWNP